MLELQLGKAEMLLQHPCSIPEHQGGFRGLETALLRVSVWSVVRLSLLSGDTEEMLMNKKFLKTPGELGWVITLLH